jgi:hypothetical protein
MKIRYVVKNKYTDRMYNKYYSLEQIEVSGLNGLFDIENYNIVSRDRFIKTIDEVDIYENDKLEGNEYNLCCYSLIEYDEENGRFQINDYGYNISIGEGSQEIIGNEVEKVDENIYDIEDIDVKDLIPSINVILQ